MRVSLLFPGFEPIPTILPQLRIAEDLGLDGVWLAEHVSYSDNVVPATLAASLTERIDIGMVGLNTRTRHPGVTAMEVASLAELAPGRFRLAVGPGESDLLRYIGESIVKPIATTGAFMDVLRRGLAGEQITGEFPGFTFEEFQLRGGPVPGIDVAAIRPRMLGLAAEHADGVALSVGASRPYIRQTLSFVEQQLEKFGRSRAEYRTWAVVAVAVDPDLEKAYQDVLPLFSEFADPRLANELAVDILEPDAWLRAGEEGKESIRRMLTPEVVGGASIIARPDELAGALAEYADTGLDEVAVLLYGDADKRLDAVRMVAEAAAELRASTSAPLLTSKS